MPFCFSQDDQPTLILTILDSIFALGAVIYVQLGTLTHVSQLRGSSVSPIVYFAFRSLVLLRRLLLWLRALISQAIEVSCARLDAPQAGWLWPWPPLHVTINGWQWGPPSFHDPAHGWPLLFGEGCDVDFETLAQV